MFFVWILFHISWKGLCFFYLFDNVLLFLKTNDLNINTKIKIMDPTLLPITILFLLGGIINYFWFQKQRDIFTRIIAIKMMVNNKTLFIKRDIIRIPFDLKIIKAGSNYFKKLISNKKLPKTSDFTDEVIGLKKDESDCIICYSNPSNVLIRPCNHGGLCENCTITYLGTNNTCPICKCEIQKIFVMNFDLKNQKYLGEKVLTMI